MDLTEVKKKREQFLVTIYELADGEANREVDTRRLAELLEIEYDTEASKIGRYWLQLDMVKWTSFERIFLTPLGLSAAEKIIEDREQQETTNRRQETLKCPRCDEPIRSEAQFCEHCGAALNATTLRVEDHRTSPTLQSLVGTVLDLKYEILAPLGRGGVGTVYRAKRVHIGDEVALKVLHATDPSFGDRFQREASAAAKVSHPNIVKIYDFSKGNENSPAYLVMELVKGESLEDLLKREGRLEPLHATWLGREICKGVGAAHELGVFHRDLKPSNVIVLPSSSETVAEAVKIIDFGIAKVQDSSVGIALTQAGTVIGTPVYMSPEQCRGEDCDARSDVYSIGLIVYQMIAGEPPFKAANNADVIAKHLVSEPDKLGTRFGVSPELEAVIMRALAKDRSDRQFNASALSAELRDALKTQQQSQPSSGSKHTEPVSRSVDPSETTLTYKIQRLSNLEETDLIVFRASCGKALTLKNLMQISVPDLVNALKGVPLSQQEIVDAVEVLSKEGYIRVSNKMGCGLRICEFEITRFGFQQYLTAFIPDYEAKRRSVLVDLLQHRKDVFEKPDLITEHILDVLADEGLIEISKFIGGRIKVMHVSAQLRRKDKTYKAIVPNSVEAEPEESFTTRAAKLVDELAYKQERESWLRSAKSREDAQHEVAKLFDELLLRAVGITEQGIEIETALDAEECTLRWHGISLLVSWNPGRIVNSLEGTGLTMRLSETSKPVKVYDDNVSFIEEKLSERYDVTMAPNRDIGWRETQGSKRVLPSSKIADIWVDHFIKAVERVLAVE